MALEIPTALRNQLKQVPGLRPLVRHLRQYRNHRALATRALPPLTAIELTNTCNLRCAKCPLSSTTRTRGFVDDSLFEKILHDIEAANAPTEIALSGAGEPTLHPHLIEFVKAARSIHNVGVIGFATNGVALTPDLSERLLDAGLTRLKASLDTDNANEYEKLNGADRYEQVFANFMRFCEINKRTGHRCKVTLKATLYENDLTLGRRIAKQWGPHVDRVRVTPIHNWAGTKGARAGNAARRPCPMPWSQVGILWDGQITVCCIDSMEGRLKMGNANEINLSDYWLHNEVLKQLRRQHVAGDLSAFPVCATCDICEYADINL